MAIISHKVEGVSNDVTHYARVYPVNKKGHAQSELDGQIASALTNAFPAEPSSYNLIGTYSSSQTFTAPEDGWYQIEVFGASGKGAAHAYKTGLYRLGTSSTIYYFWYVGGAGGGSGAYAKSTIKLKAGDTIVLTRGAVGSVTTAVVTSSVDELYSHTITCNAAGNGSTKLTTSSTTITCTTTAGSAGTASGGLDSNVNGNKGTTVSVKYKPSTNGSGWSPNTSYSSGTGSGGAAVNGGNAGGKGGGIILKTGNMRTEHDDDGGKYTYYDVTTSTTSAGSGSPGFFKIYRGDTNVVAA